MGGSEQVFISGDIEMSLCVCKSRHHLAEGKGQRQGQGRLGCGPLRRPTNFRLKNASFQEKGSRRKVKGQSLSLRSLVEVEKRRLQ